MCEDHSSTRMFFAHVMGTCLTCCIPFRTWALAPCGVFGPTDPRLYLVGRLIWQLSSGLELTSESAGLGVSGGACPPPSVFPAFVVVPCGLLQFVENMDFLVLQGQVPKLIRYRRQRHGPELCPLLERVAGHSLATAPGFPCHPHILHGHS